MNQQEQKEHDRAVEVFVDTTLAGAQRVLAVIEADVRLCDTVIPTEDEQLWNVVASRAFMSFKLFEGYSITLALNDHIRGVLMAPGRAEVNNDIEVRMDRITKWLEKTKQSHPPVAQMMQAMGWAATTASQLYRQHPGQAKL